MKVTILLEELNYLKGIEYDAWKIEIFGLDQFGSDFVQINPNSKIPALLDTTHDPPLRVFESGSILKYIAEKYDAFIPKDPCERVECFNWLFWQMASAP
jgi:GST-like protein